MSLVGVLKRGSEREFAALKSGDISRSARMGVSGILPDFAVANAKQGTVLLGWTVMMRRQG